MTAFITRAQTPDSEFSRLLQTQGWEVYGQSLVTLNPLPFETVPACDWIFFASQNAVHFFFRQVREHGIPLSEVKWAALGKSTAAVLTQYISILDFIGNGEPDATATAFQWETEHPETVRVLFPAARHSMDSVAYYLPERFQILHLVVYDNQSVPNPPHRTDDVLVFTSPMNARTYFSYHALLPGQKAIAIGATTAAALTGMGITNVIVAAEPNERSLAEAARTVI